MVETIPLAKLVRMWNIFRSLWEIKEITYRISRQRYVNTAILAVNTATLTVNTQPQTLSTLQNCQHSATDPVNTQPQILSTLSHWPCQHCPVFCLLVEGVWMTGGGVDDWRGCGWLEGVWMIGWWWWWVIVLQTYTDPLTSAYQLDLSWRSPPYYRGPF